MYNSLIDIDNYFRLGKVIKTFGYKGEMIILIESDDPSRYEALEMIFVDINGSLVPWFPESIELNEDRAKVKLEDIDTPEQAREFTGRDVYLPLKNLRTLEDNRFYFHELIGYNVIDEEHGEVGIVAEILDRPEQEIIRIEKGNKEILIPLSEEMIKSLDKKSRILYVNTPLGLIDLYLE
jgi:16S rRNA processing protein RimM